MPPINFIQNASCEALQDRVAYASDRKRWKKIGIRQIIRKSGLNQKVVYAVLEGNSIRKQTLATFKRAMEIDSPQV